MDGCRSRGRQRQDFLQDLVTAAGTESGTWLRTSDTDMAHKDDVNECDFIRLVMLLNAISLD